MGLHQIKKFPHWDGIIAQAVECLPSKCMPWVQSPVLGKKNSKGHNYLCEEEPYWMGGIFTSYLSDSGLISRLYKEFKKSNTKTIDDLINKW
jgi:hypothetical protein